jgi:cytochrome c-type biogenesis protein CcmF
VGTALMHSLAVTEKRKVFKSWTVLLAIAAFSLSLLGTFLVRSGVLVSVHSFASDPSRGLFILGLLVVVIGGSLLLYAVRASQLKSVGRYEMFSREMMLMGNNVLLVAATIVVLLGTLLPLVHKELGLGTISIGAPFFNQMFTLLIVPFVLFMAVGPLSRWKNQRPSALRNQLLLAFVLALSAGILVNFSYDEPTYMGTLGMVMSFWILIAIILEVRQRVVSTTRSEPIFASLRKLTASHWGMVLGHVGFAVTLIGISLVSNYELERDVRMTAGDTVEIADYTVSFTGVEQIEGPNYSADRGIFDVYKNGEFVNHLEPEKRFYPVQRTSMTEAGIHTTLTRDLFIALGEPLSNDAWAIRLYYKPFVVWIWGGAVIMAIGGIFSISDKRYRIKKMAKWKNIGGANNNDDGDSNPSPAGQQSQGNKGGNLVGEHT